VTYFQVEKSIYRPLRSRRQDRQDVVFYRFEKDFAALAPLRFNTTMDLSEIFEFSTTKGPLQRYLWRRLQ